MIYSYGSVSQSCPTLCDPIDCSTPGFSVHHPFLEHAQTQMIWYYLKKSLFKHFYYFEYNYLYKSDKDKHNYFCIIYCYISCFTKIFTYKEIKNGINVPKFMS